MKTTPENFKFIFLGNEEFGLPVISELLPKYSRYFDLIVTSHDTSNVFDNLCLKNDIPLCRVDNINNFENEITKYKSDALLVCGWSQIINSHLLSKIKCIGMHPTLLPERRGRCPITWTLIDGVKESGVTIFYLDEGVDSGDIIYQEKFTIHETYRSIDLINEVNTLLISMFSDVIKSFPDLPRIKQDEKKSTYKRLRTEIDDEIDLNKSKDSILRHIRANSPPYPYAYIRNKSGEKIYIKEVLEK